tara:strand:+ start:376 stop:675 length:300 start_codon:yes stop_codon:yes gene_type:complete
MKLVLSEKGRLGILVYKDPTGLGCVSITGSGLLSYTNNIIDQRKINTMHCTVEDLTHMELRQLLSNMEYLNKSSYIGSFIKNKMIKNIDIHQRIIHSNS